MENIFVIEHPLVQHKLSLLRDKKTGTKEFRELVFEISMLIGYEVTRDMPLKEVEIETPMGLTKTKVISGKKLGFIPITRAGLGMVDAMLNLIPSARVGHFGMFRDPETLEPVKYYCKLPYDAGEREMVLLEPMLATGGTACAAVEHLESKGIKSMKILCIVASRQGIERVATTHPDVQIYCAAVDEKLNEHGYIIPGLGDAGDRLFGTK